MALAYKAHVPDKVCAGAQLSMWLHARSLTSIYMRFAFCLGPLDE